MHGKTHEWCSVCTCCFFPSHTASHAGLELVSVPDPKPTHAWGRSGDETTLESDVIMQVGHYTVTLWVS